MHMAIHLLDIHVVVAIKAAENYSNISVGFRNIFYEVNRLIQDSALMIDGINYDLEFYLCSDYKVNTST